MSDPQPRAKMSAGMKLLIAAVLLLIVAVAQYLFFNGFGTGNTQDIRMTDTDRFVTYDFDASASFYSYDSKNFYFCTKDGMRYGTSGTEVKWLEIFSLTKPIMVADGDAVAVGDAKGRHIYVFGPDGLLYDVAFDDPVLYFNINANGYLSVILQLDTGYEVQVYHSRSGDRYLYANKIRDALYFPTAADVSADGKYIVIAMLDLNVRLSSRAAFYYINSQDAWLTEQGDGLFAGNDYRDEMIYSVKFMENNCALVFTDAQIACYQPGESNTLNELWSVPMHNKVERLTFYKGRRFAYVTGDKLLNDDEAVEPGMVRICDVSGEQTGEFALGRKATYLSMGCDSVMVGADRSFYALNSRGGRLWEHITMQDTRQFIFLENTDTVLIAGGNRADVLKRTRPKVTNVPAEERFITGDEPLNEETTP